MESILPPSLNAALSNSYRIDSSPNSSLSSLDDDLHHIPLTPGQGQTRHPNATEKYPERDFDDDYEEDEEIGYGLKGYSRKGRVAREEAGILSAAAREGRISLKDDEDREGFPPSPASILLAHRRRHRLLLLIPPSLLVLALFLFFLIRYSNPPQEGNHFHTHLERFTLDSVLDGRFNPVRKDLEWLETGHDGARGEGGSALAGAGNGGTTSVGGREHLDGTFTYVDHSTGDILLEHVERPNQTDILVRGEDLKDTKGNRLSWNKFRISPDGEYILFRADTQQLWRRSSRSNFYVHSLLDGTTHPLIPPDQPPKTSIAIWGPVGHTIAYVHSNDLYILLPSSSSPLSSPSSISSRLSSPLLPNPTSLRLTESGSETVFNGVPDWVYEEEVFESEEALWWSAAAASSSSTSSAPIPPDDGDYGIRLAYLVADETKVKDFCYPRYNSNPYLPGGEPYPEDVCIRYPKPGFENPLVETRVFDLGSWIEEEDSKANRKGKGKNKSAAGGRKKNDQKDAGGKREEMENYSDSMLTKRAINPSILKYTYSLSFSKPFSSSSTSLTTDVVWVSSHDLILKQTNRIQNVEKWAHFDLRIPTNGGTDRVMGDGHGGKVGEIVGKVVREVDWEEKDGGWIESGHFITGAFSSNLKTPQDDNEVPAETIPPGYLDILPDQDGFMHIGFFSPPDAADPVFLTTGEWEVADKVLKTDVERKRIYFIAANPSTERHLYSIPLPTKTSLQLLRTGGTPTPPTPLTNTSIPGYYSASFSPQAGYLSLNYDGPDIPWQKVIKIDENDAGGQEPFERILEDNFDLRNTTKGYLQPTRVQTSYEVEPGVDLNVVELRPPNFDDSGRVKYPLFIRYYGGPGSQNTGDRFNIDWHSFLAGSLGVLVINVDPRGTGFKGRGFRVGVRNNLGELEAHDVIETTRHYASLPYVDEKRVGAWGWSYGGYLTAKIIEANSGVFTLGASVAPVADWRYYDSVYTERYMSTPELNADGYTKSAVTDMTGFTNVSYLLMHGTGDDNVHFLNSAVLLDRLTFAEIRNFVFRAFTDSNHSMGTRGAYQELFAYLTKFLSDNWGLVKKGKQHPDSRN